MKIEKPTSSTKILSGPDNQMANIDSIGDLLNSMKVISGQFDGKDSDRIWFRGEQDINRQLQPSVFRKDNKLAEVETHLTTRFQVKASQFLHNCPVPTAYDEWLTLMQHYGLPTRALDWSLSPLVALFFATQPKKDEKETDGVIYVLFPRILNQAEHSEPFVLPMFNRTVKAAIAPAFTSKEQLPIRRKSNHHRSEKSLIRGSIIACYASYYNPRVQLQQSAFTIHTSKDRTINDIDAQCLFKLRIPHAAKKNLFESLTILGITEDFLSPDLSTIAKQVKTLGENRAIAICSTQIAANKTNYRQEYASKFRLTHFK